MAEHIVNVSASISTDDWKVIGATNPPGYEDLLDDHLIAGGVWLGNKNHEQPGGLQAFDLATGKTLMFNLTLVAEEVN